MRPIADVVGRLRGATTCAELLSNLVYELAESSGDLVIRSHLNTILEWYTVNGFSQPGKATLSSPVMLCALPQLEHHM